eukprot:gene10944-3650_t
MFQLIFFVYDSKEKEKRTFIISEFLETERTYVSNLKILVNDFLEPLKKDQNLLKENSRKIIFGNIETVLKINSLFLEDVESIKNFNLLQLFVRNKEEINLANIILHFCESFKLYSTYIFNYNSSLKMLKEEKKQNIKFVEFLQKMKMELKKRGERIVEIDSFLILPIQRLPRYRMLLDDLKSKVSDSSTKEKLNLALQKVCEVTIYVNDKQKEEELILKMIEIQEKIKISIIEPHRKFVNEYEVMFKKSNQNMMIYIFNDIIVYKSSGILKKTKKIMKNEMNFSSISNINLQKKNFF